ncbi:hypothetical protein NEPAR06_0934 [Nematocida parisii]|uniref:Uncharacterized protein n=1 Tax=Nematocida parisii (strain ERTm3) TaxID=935791 RepID=I3EDR0_NEMP3|nr:hypothetical protein NEQG_02480 [Nematocida parisii ERTm3]KAI5127583.1 hypothetical protein NEPAR08_0953 [Nematocida parisii]KAI5127858.1 hypothetical protein NEPAR03_1138 [Nematocida parisii]KAI5141626.1 hypothetical protein NEPAR04_1103 [Nematocida parisii]KAI5145623.1 hypothetical protein NEPAR07_1823 [Nematocida parisii]
MDNSHEKSMRAKLRKEFPSKLTGKVIKNFKGIVMSIISRCLPKNLEMGKINNKLDDLEYNMQNLLIFGRIDEGARYIENDLITMINSSIKIAKHIVADILNASTIITDEEMKMKYYNMMNNNYLIGMEIYKSRHDFFYKIIRQIATNQDVKPAGIKRNSSTALNSLIMPTESKDCSRLQRAWDIITKHGEALDILNQEGNEESNMAKLGLSKDDIYSLYLFTNADFNSVMSISELMYNLVSIEDSSKSVHSLTNFVHREIVKLLLSNSENNLSERKRINILKSRLKDILGLKRVFVMNGYQDAINNVCNKYGIDISNFEANVVQKYLEAVKNQLYAVSGCDIDIDMSNMLKKVDKELALVLETTDDAVVPPTDKKKNNFEINDSKSYGMHMPTKNSWTSTIFTIFLIIFIVVLLIASSIYTLRPTEAKIFWSNSIAFMENLLFMTKREMSAIYLKGAQIYEKHIPQSIKLPKQIWKWW